MTATMVAEGDSTRVDVGTDLTITGRPAQFGRGMLSDVGGRLIGQFADCLEKTLAGEEKEEKAGGAAAEAPGPERAPEAAQGAGGTAAEPSVGMTTREDREVQPIDLLEITGIGATLRRYAPQLAAAAGVAAVFYLLGRRSRRRR